MLEFREFDKIAGYKISISKLVALVYTMLFEKKLGGTIPFTTVAKILKCLRINLTKDMRNL